MEGLDDEACDDGGVHEMGASAAAETLVGVGAAGGDDEDESTGVHQAYLDVADGDDGENDDGDDEDDDEMGELVVLPEKVDGVDDADVGEDESDDEVMLEMKLKMLQAGVVMHHEVLLVRHPKRMMKRVEEGEMPLHYSNLGEMKGVAQKEMNEGACDGCDFLAAQQGTIYRFLDEKMNVKEMKLL